MNIISSFSVSLILVSFIVYYAVPARHQWKVLLAASTIYFALMSPFGTAVMALCSLISFFSAKIISKSSQIVKKRIVLIISTLIYLAAWVFVKVFSKFASGEVLFFSTLDVSETATALGCSYFVLRYISYTADVYTEKTKPEKNFFKLLLFYIYFPAILQGPIERYGKFKKKLFSKEKKKITYKNIRQAGILILQGLFKVYVISRFCALFTQYMNDPEGKNALFLIFAIFLYTFQIYTDFSGSIDIVRGLSFLFGIELSENFRLPYLSQNFSEFWKRWHITFSSWLKDYIYIPLGGSRHGKLRSYINLIIVFAVSGIWHDFSLTFLIWGLLQAIYQIVEKLFSRTKKTPKQGAKKPHLIVYLLKSLKVFVLATFGWIFFNASSLSHVGKLFSSIGSSFKTLPSVGLKGFLADTYGCLDTYRNGLNNRALIFYVFLIAAMTIFAIIKDRRRFDFTDPERVKIGFRWAYYIIMFAIILTFGFYGDTFSLSSFIYGAF